MHAALAREGRVSDPLADGRTADCETPLGAYESAWERSPAARFDPSMQAHLLETATTNSDRLRSRARRLITQIYQRDEILRALNARVTSVRGDERTRLERLRATL